MLIVARSASKEQLGPLPGAQVDATGDRNLVRLYAVWTSDTPYIHALSVIWRFNGYDGIFRPTADDRKIGTPENRFIYAYEPSPRGPFRKGAFRRKRWEAWTITAPAVDVETAEITVLCPDHPAEFVMAGGIISRDGKPVAIDGPTANTAHCLFEFT